MMIFDIIRYFMCRISNGRSLRTESIFKVRTNDEIKATKGMIDVHKGLSIHTNVHLVAVKGGILRIGSNVFFGRNCIVVARGNISIGDNTAFGPNVCIYDHNHVFDYDGVHEELNIGSIMIGSSCWIGAGVTILKNANIGDGSVIGAGTVVSGYIPPHSIVTSKRELEITPIKER